MEILKENLNEKEKNFWSFKFYLLAYNIVKNRKIPLVIPSYNRYDKNILIDYIKSSINKEYEWPIYIVVRKSQEIEYKKLIKGFENTINILSFEDNLINDIGKVKIQIVKYFNCKSIFLVDDDVKIFCKTISKDKNNINKFATIKNLDFAHIMASWQLAHEYVSEKFNAFGSCLSNEGFSFCEKTGDINKPYKLGAMMSVCCCYNLDILKKHNINFVSMKESGHDDLDLTFKCLEKGLLPIYFNFMSYSAPPPQNNITNQFGYNNNDERMIQFDNIILNNYKHLPFIQKKIHKKRKNYTPCVNWKYYLNNYFIKINNYKNFDYKISSNLYEDILLNKNSFYFQKENNENEIQQDFYFKLKFDI